MRFFDWYKAIYVAQIEMEEFGESIRILEDSLLKMPNIRIIISDNCDNFDKGFRHLEMWLTSIPDKNWRYFALSDDAWERGILEPIREGEGRAVKSTMDLINTSHCLGYTLKSFEFNISGHWLREGIFHNNSKLWGCASLFKNLTCLSVSITTLDSHENDSDFLEMAKAGKLSKFLSFAPLLKKQSLAVESCIVPSLFTGVYFKTLRILLLDILGRGNNWEYLHTFHLKFPAVLLKEIVDFLGHHAVTVKCLHLDTPLILNGTWRELLEFLKERLHITDFEIAFPCDIRFDKPPPSILRSFNEEAKSRIKYFVLHQGASFPPTKQELEENGWDIEMYYDSEEESEEESHEEEEEEGDDVEQEDEEEEEEAEGEEGGRERRKMRKVRKKWERRCRGIDGRKY
ncbi:hypothetical protein RUND412_011559 [Rhizina undulata]